MKRPTISDVARLAGVSTTTVSHVINETRFVEEATKQRVLKAIDELGYRPSMIARGLALQRTHTLGLIIADVTNPFFSELACGVLDAAQDREYDVFVCNSGAKIKAEMRALYSLADHNVDGVIIFPSWRNEEKLRDFAERNRPLVVVNRDFQPHPGIGQIVTDTYKGARLAVDYLVAQGHPAIGMLAGYVAYSPVFRRVRGFYDAVAACGLPLEDGWVVPVAPPIISRGRQAARELLSQHPELTAIFAYNDLLAMGAVQACQDLGRRVPEDCAVVGFDDIQMAELFTPALTTIHVDKYELGRQTVDLLVKMLEDPEGEFGPIHLDVELVVRESA
jgi:LacI family transcriptional regulator